jgi:uncharacterized protein YdeI (BOF family)
LPTNARDQRPGLNEFRLSLSETVVKNPLLLVSILLGLAAYQVTSVQAEETSPEKPTAEAVTPVGDLRRGTMATVQGTVERILDTDEFRLTDKSGSVRVYVGPNWVPADVGEVVTVRGFVDDDIGPLELYARSLTRADGSVVSFDPRRDE